MNPQLTAEYDDALVGLEAFANLAGSSWIEDPQQDHDAGSNAWLARWVRHPLTLLRVFDSLYARATAALSEVSLEIALIRERRASGDSAADDVFARRAAELLCHEADLTARVGRPAEERILAARTRTLEMLRQALRRGSEAGSRIETYRRLVEEVGALAGWANVSPWPLELAPQPTVAPARATRTGSGIAPVWLAGSPAGRPPGANAPDPPRP